MNPDLLRRLQVLASPRLEPGSELLAGARLDQVVDGTAARIGVLGRLTPFVRGLADPRRETVPPATVFPSDQQSVVALTGTSLLVFSSSARKGRPKRLLAELPLASITRLEFERSGRGRHLVFEFADGQVARFETRRRDDAIVFAEKFAAIRTPSTG